MRGIEILSGVVYESCSCSITIMNQGGEQEQEQDQEQDMVMPGFRFHPTEEELVEFYLRRKVQGKKFNVDLITLLDLYRFDPWELPALAAIGEKDWYFYVPRDRKYRNGDRPNRVTTSGYWKATGADRMIRSENCQSIGLKKTLVFYSGKAPKGIRTSWIMNEYRLPHHETQLLQKAEISLCRVYKRAGIQDQPCLQSATTKQSSKKQREISHRSYHKNHLNQMDNKTEKTSGSSSSSSRIALIPSSISETETTVVPHASLLVPYCPNTIFSGSTTSTSYMEPLQAVDDLHGLMNYQKQQASLMINNHHQHQELPTNLQLHAIVNQSLQTGFPDRLWDLNSLTDHGIRKDYTAPY